MKNLYWNNSDLRLVEEWDWVSRFIDAQIPTYIPDSDLIRKTSLEARLIIQNKLVIIYNPGEDQPSGIMSFKEFITLKEDYKETGKEILFHPINFQSLKEFNQFLLKTREKLFSLTNNL